MSDILQQNAQTTQWVGIDISKDTFDVHIHPANILKVYPNTSKGHREFIKYVQELSIDKIAYEATGAYHGDLEQALAKAALPAVKVNPQRARRFAQAIGKLAKTDKVDAELLARFAANLQPEVTPVKSEAIRQLSELACHRRGLIKDRTAALTRAKTARDVLIKKQLQKRLKEIRADIMQVDQRMETIIKSDEELTRRYEILSSISGVGPTTARTLLAEMPELGTLDPKQAAALAGLAPMTRESGQWKGTSFIQGGRRFVRQALYMPSLVAMRFNKDLKRKYEELIAKGKKPKVAIVALMRKLIILANTLIKQNRCWNEGWVVEANN